MAARRCPIRASCRHSTRVPSEMRETQAYYEALKTRLKAEITYKP